MTMKTTLWAMVIGGLLLVGCAVDDAEPSKDADEVVWTVDEDRVRSDDGSEASDGDDGLSEKAGCVHIQWCNEPGPVGTVCIWDACSLAAAVRECTADANAVCGGITQPAHIR
jgi:hypothetical protein